MPVEHKRSAKGLTKKVRRLLAGGAYARAREAVWEFFVALRLPYYFRLGLGGFALATGLLFVLGVGLYLYDFFFLTPRRSPAPAPWPVTAAEQAG